MNALGQFAGTACILHSRKASDPTTINITKLHPFCRPGEGAGIMFCQNGTIRKHEQIASDLGQDAIDSEKYFDLFMKHHAISRDLESAFHKAAQDIHDCGADPTSLNAIASTGTELVAYRGKVVPENETYNTMFTAQHGDVMVASTETFDSDGVRLEWEPLDGTVRWQFRQAVPAH